MRVKATQLGYHELQRRYPGEEFLIEDNLFSKTWMECVDPDEHPAPKVKPLAKGKNGKKTAKDRLDAGEGVGLSELQGKAPLASDEDVI